MKQRGVHLQYTFHSEGQRGAQLHNPLFELLQALREHGSIQHAAKASGASYRHVWGALRHWEEVLGETLVSHVQGQPTRLTPFAERLLWSEARARVRMAPHIEALRAELERVLAEAFDGSQPVLSLRARHDPLLPQLREHLQAVQGPQIDLRATGTSTDALRRLAEGGCQLAGLALPAHEGLRRTAAQWLRPWIGASPLWALACARRRQGLLLARGNPLHLLPQGPWPTLRWVQRPAGSLGQALAQQWQAEAGIAGASLQPVMGEGAPLAVAAAIASGAAAAGIGPEAAAQAFGLDFLPLHDEDYWLLAHARDLAQPALRSLRDALAHPHWREPRADASTDWRRLSDLLPRARGEPPVPTPSSLGPSSFGDSAHG